MTLTDIIVIAVIALILTAVIIYIVRQKKKGVKCIGCPSSGTCSDKKDKNDSCNCH